MTLVGLVCSLLAVPYLPERVPSHWDAAGEVNGYNSRTQALWFMPFLILSVDMVILYLPKFDPLRKNVDLFRPSFHWMVIGLTLFNVSRGTFYRQRRIVSRGTFYTDYGAWRGVR